MDAWTWLSDGNYPDLIVSDIKMPMVDGIELLENLSTSGLFKNIPVVVLTGLYDHQARERCLEFGAIAYLIKPFAPQTLLRTIEHQLVPKMF